MPEPTIAPPTADQKRIAADQFTRAKDAIANAGLDYAIDLLLTCCRIDPGNFVYRQTLRKTQKEKYGNNLRGSRFAFFSTPRWKAKLKNAKRNRDYPKVLEHAEQVLCRNPWDLGTQMDMAEAFDALGFPDLAVFSLDQARQKFPKDATLNRALARLFEKRGDFQKAIALWQMVKEINPADVEAAHKAMHLAASETIRRGQYEESAAGTKESPAIGQMEARAAEKHDRLAKDVEPLRKRIEADPTEPTLYLQLATLYRKHGQNDRARAVLQQALGPTGDAFPIQIELMEMDLIPVRKQLDELEVRIRKREAKASKHDDDEDEETMTVSELNGLRKQLLVDINGREVEIFRMKAQRFPNDPSHRLELGTRLLKADKTEEAIAELQQVKRDDKLKWRAGLYLGVCFRKRKNWRLAQRNFEEALAAVPQTEDSGKKELLFQLASGSAENGDMPRAVDLGNELANLDYSYKGIGKLLDDWTEQARNM